MPDKAEDLVRAIFEGTAAHTGPAFFEALVRQLAGALGVAGAWVTEFDSERRRMRALAFWYQDHFIHDYEYPLVGTPCEPVVDECSLFHVPKNVVELYPRDPDLRPLRAVSYLGMPFVDPSGLVIGHLAVLDTRPMELAPRIEALFRVFAARASAEIQRLRVEALLREREQELSTLLDSTGEAILAVDSKGYVRNANKASARLFSRKPEDLNALSFSTLLSEAGAKAWVTQLGSVEDAPFPRRFWIEELELLAVSGKTVSAEASVSELERRGERMWTLVLRDLNERREAERQLAALKNESDYLQTEFARPPSMIGESPAMRALFTQISQVGPTEATVLIEGETGTGKELIARAIHEASGRASRPMIRVNAAAIPSTLMESELFGHERGAFTGATQRRDGRFTLADGGSIFLDEIGELPLDLQAKLLRVLQEGEFEPVGCSRTRKVDVRVIAATNRDLRAESDAGRFRADLYFRLNVFPIHVPPLRERGRDVILLATAFLQRLGQKMGRTFRPLSPRAVSQILAYDWPGNVRELENVLQRAAILSRDGEIRVEGLPPPPPRSAAGPPSEPGHVLTAAQLLDLERENLTRALETSNWRVSGPGGAAAMLGVPPSTFASRMKALGVGRRRENSRE